MGEAEQRKQCNIQGQPLLCLPQAVILCKPNVYRYAVSCKQPAAGFIRGLEWHWRHSASFKLPALSVPRMCSHSHHGVYTSWGESGQSVMTVQVADHHIGLRAKCAKQQSLWELSQLPKSNSFLSTDRLAQGKRPFQWVCVFFQQACGCQGHMHCWAKAHNLTTQACTWLTQLIAEWFFAHSGQL